MSSRPWAIQELWPGLEDAPQTEGGSREPLGSVGSLPGLLHFRCPEMSIAVPLGVQSAVMRRLCVCGLGQAGSAVLWALGWGLITGAARRAGEGISPWGGLPGSSPALCSSN